MRIIILTSEIVPFASTGGLGDVCASFPKALARQGVDVIRMMPLYGHIDREQFGLEASSISLQIPLGKTTYTAGVWIQRFEGVTTYFIHNTELFDRLGIYGDAEKDFSDNFERFLFFQKAAVSLIDALNLDPDVVHCNDWQTGLVPMFLQHGIDGRGRSGSEKTLMTIHNLAFQGWAPAEKFPLTQLPDACYSIEGMEFYHEINSLKAGLVRATAINAVSPTNAREILTPSMGCNLEGVLHKRRDVLSGILNGIDYERWDPEKDPYITKTYSCDDLTGKAVCKEALQRAAGFNPDPEVPLLAMISRLSSHKGIDLVVACMDEIMETGAQLVVLGTGEDQFERALRRFMKRYPDQMCAWIEFSSEKAHQIEAGADLFLMPSSFEPCGQNQMYSLRYGTIPVVHGVGGLEDSVINYGERGGTGFKFHGHSAEAFMATLTRALQVYGRKKRWNTLVRRAMQKDFSVVHMAKQYITLYRHILRSHAPMD